LRQRSVTPACLARTSEKAQKFALVRRFIWGIPVKALTARQQDQQMGMTA
jgi:hypothetical protein